MGLSTNLHDVSSDSIPLHLVVAALGWVTYLRSLLLCLFHYLGLLHRSADHPALSTVGSALAGLIALTDHLRSNPSFTYPNHSDKNDCLVCLCGLRGGERVRRLPCCHVFHSDCLDGWFDQLNLSCPLCRSPLVPQERRADAEQRMGADIVALLSSPSY